MKTFLLFVGAEYYPAGGWKDYKGDFDDLMELLRHTAKVLREEFEEQGAWAHIYDRHSDVIHEIDLANLKILSFNG